MIDDLESAMVAVNPLETGALTVTTFTPLQSLAGGDMIGLAAVLLMALHGRVAGITGILTGLLRAARCSAVFGIEWELDVSSHSELRP